MLKNQFIVGRNDVSDPYRQSYMSSHFFQLFIDRSESCLLYFSGRVTSHINMFLLDFQVCYLYLKGIYFIHNEGRGATAPLEGEKYQVHCYRGYIVTVGKSNM